MTATESFQSGLGSKISAVSLVRGWLTATCQEVAKNGGIAEGVEITAR